jgi:hypothetical protein
MSYGADIQDAFLCGDEECPFIGMVPRQQAQPVTAITTPLAGVHIGAQVFALVGTNAPTTLHLKK